VENLTQRVIFVGAVIVVLIVLGAIGYMLTRPIPTPTTPTPTPTVTTVITPTTPTPPQVVRISTAALGTATYVIGAYLADIWNRELADLGIRFFVMPFPSPETGVKAIVLGEIEMGYVADVHFMDLYTWGKEFGIITGLEGLAKRLPVPSIWFSTSDTFFLIKAEDVGKYKCWRDLEGKNVFLTPVGFGNHLNALRMLRAVGVKVNHVEISLAAVADALERGTIVATVLYVVAGTMLPPWGKELDLKMKLAPLNPCPDEIEKLKAAGLTVRELDAAQYFDKNKDMGKIIGMPWLFSWSTAIDVPEDIVYRMLVALEKNAKDYVKVSAYFKEVAEDIVGLQLMGVKWSIAYGIPVHPGLAKYLKEKGVWNPEWDKYIARELIPKLVKG
jgi:TRAP-type uncharacterized transport system substrate-binding protein